MSKNRRTIILIFIAIVVLVVVVWWLFTKFQKPPTVISPGQDVPAAVEVIGPDDSDIQEELNKQISGKSDQEVSDQAKIIAAGRFFVERYGSFSSQANWQNLSDVKPVVTRQLWDEFENLIAKNPIDSEGKYYSLTTKVLSLRLVTQADSLATIEVKTQKQETNGSESRIFYQDVTVNLVKDGEQWIVNDFDWGEERQ